MFRDVPRPPVDEHLDGVLQRNPSIRSFVFMAKLYESIPDLKNTPLRDGRTPNIASTVPEKMLLSPESSDMGYPPAPLLTLEQTFNLIGSHFICKLTGRRHLSKNCNY